MTKTALGLLGALALGIAVQPAAAAPVAAELVQQIQYTSRYEPHGYSNRHSYYRHREHYRRHRSYHRGHRYPARRY